MANVMVRENPRTDPVTVANSTVDVYRGLLDDNAAEQVRLTEKVARLRGYVSDAQVALDESKARRTNLTTQLEQATAARNVLAAANPDLAAEIEAERAAARGVRIADLEAELGRLRERD